MRHLSLRGDLRAQRSLRSQRDVILGRFAVYQKATARGRVIVGHFCSETVALFAYKEKQADIDAIALQTFRRRNLRRDDSLGITRTASVDAIRVLRRKNEWWNRIHVRGEDHEWIRMIGMNRVNVEAIALDRHLFGLIANTAEFAVEIVPDSSFVA